MRLVSRPILQVAALGVEVLTLIYILLSGGVATRTFSRTLDMSAPFLKIMINLNQTMIMKEIYMVIRFVA